ncbi:MAG: mechanosensitive ion channel domain-containing protein [Pseudomonadota bacterium]
MVGAEQVRSLVGLVRPLAVLTLIGLVLVGAGWAEAQSPAALSATQEAAPDPTQAVLDSPEAVRAMVAQLSDSEVRGLLLARLDAEAEPKEPSDIMAIGDFIDSAAAGFSSSVGVALQRVPNLAGGIGEAVSRFYTPRGASGTAMFFAVLALSLVAGWAASWAIGRVLRPVLTPLDAEPVPHSSQSQLASQVRRLAQRLASAAAQAAAYLGVACGIISLVASPTPQDGRPSDQLVLWFLLTLPVLYTVAMKGVAEVLLSPDAPKQRLMAMDDRTARLLHDGLVVFAAIAGIRIFALSFLGGHGIALGDLRLGFWLSLALYAWLMFVAWRARTGLTHALIGDLGEVTATERRMAEIYPYLAMVLILVFWALTEVFVGLELWYLLDGRLPLTLLILIFAPVVDRVIRALVYGVAPPPEGEGELAEQAFAETRRSYIRVGRVVSAGLVLALISEIWQFSVVEMASSGVGQRFAGRLLEALIIVGVGYVVLEIVRIRINSMLAREKGPQVDDEEPGGGEGGGAGGSRLSTVLPLVSWGVQAAIIVITVLTALGALGVDTTPLLAGAGIVGLAVGFGAQTLVADIVSGIFFLVDDAFRVGEYVEVEGTVGTVEKISVRSLRLRHHEGPVHTIPFGQIPKLTNYSRDWVIMKLRFTVPFNTDLMKVKKLFKQIGKDMMADPALAEDFLQPFKSQGVLEVNDVGMVLRGKFMAKPGRQWTLRKEIYQRVQQAFDENGIQFARKEVRVKIDTDPSALTEEQRQAVAAAASDAAEQTDASPATGEPR